MNLTQETVKQFVSYDPDTGVFTRLVSSGGEASGKALGWQDKNGYMMARVAGKRVLLHRLAFLYMTGDMPENEIDHINRDPSDNRWENLRCASHSQNGKNTGFRKNNTSGFKGVSFHKGKKRWLASIMVDGKRINLGAFASPEDASAAYQSAAVKHFGEFASAA